MTFTFVSFSLAGSTSSATEVKTEPAGDFRFGTSRDFSSGTPRVTLSVQVKKEPPDSLLDSGFSSSSTTDASREHPDEGELVIGQ